MAAPRCRFPDVMIFIAVSEKICLDFCSLEAFTIRYVLAAFGWYPNNGPSSVNLFYQSFKWEQEPALVSSTANQICETSGEDECSLRIRGIMAKAYIAIPSGWPCVVSSVEAISPFPGIIIFIGDWYVLIRICASNGQSILMLCKTACLLMELKALVASTKRTPSVLLSWNMCLIEWTAASQPPFCLAQTCNGPASAFSMSWLTNCSRALAIICLGTSPISIGLTPGIRRHAVNAPRPRKWTGEEQIRRPTETSAEQRSWVAFVKDEQKRFHA